MRKYIHIAIIALVLISTKTHAQDFLYDEAYKSIDAMLKGEKPYSFKNAVFEVENAYKQGLLDTTYYSLAIKTIAHLTKSVMQSRTLKDYDYSDRKEVEKYAALYTVMKDSITINFKDGQSKWTAFTYDFNDIWGDDDWSNMFVSKLLDTHKGNCHSLPYLYKILAEEIGAEAHLALAPNHVYIKHRNQKDGWYNTELTSGYFPIDAWIMASGYVHLDGIRNGLYMKALNNKESLALLLVDLAQGFDKRFPENDGSFTLRCVDKALEYYPNYINALLLRLETKKKQLQEYAKSKDKEINEIMDDQDGKVAWIDLNHQVRNIHELGYRQMPKEMYLDWLVTLKEEQEKYTNKKITTFNKQN
ncbi:hypothetical protein [Seonamhaeicola marinus]|uniref:Transglutaminase domain-containing protein n=1 Tax=Seonamhaeicola marinus TaxID=1912246 RepID=A0A5D0HXS8_9FLAO|nr:hypothetical protein [Seonamhaeicola marinus]TYA74957.1 hypothetical protein FUA24_16795 [Seonamhaeicola marinus]